MMGFDIFPFLEFTVVLPISGIVPDRSSQFLLEGSTSRDSIRSIDPLKKGESEIGKDENLRDQ